jgi:branched-chain amino acid transport system ATP-binding protein
VSPLLSVEHIKVRYRNGALGVLDISFEVDAGQIVALFGPNGAGKTTSARAASGFMKTEGAKVISGRVELFGQDATSAEPHTNSLAGVSFVPERNKIFPRLTVAENLDALGRRPPPAQRREIYSFIFDMLPTLAGRRRELAGRLSGGQQQMLAIARALVNRPKLLIIDEMTLGLHPSVHGPLFEVVRRVASGGTAVLIVDESTGLALEAADYCYLLGSGRIRDHGLASKFRGNELLAAGYVEAG